MNNKFNGTVVEESLSDNRILNDLEILSIRITKEESADKRWHIYNVLVTDEQIKELSTKIKPKWYMHFWKSDKIIAVFQDKIFTLNIQRDKSWDVAIEYGILQGIPKEQLDFIIE